MLNMMYSDAIDYPIESFNLPEKHVLAYVEPLSLGSRAEAWRLVEEEIAAMHKFDSKMY